METNHEAQWIADRLATLEPHWSPNLVRGRALLDSELEKRHHSLRWIAVATATAAVCVAVLALPTTRALAQQLWCRFILNRVEVVRLDLSKLPLQMRVTTNGLEQRVQDMEEAERKAGFRPYLPSPGLLNANPSITITGPISIEQTIHVRDIESTLVKVGASDVQVPAEWEGVQLRTQIGPMVELNYPDGVQIVQTRPMELSVPSGFPLEQFAEVAFRSIGVSSWEARAMAQRFAANPAWLIDLPPDALVNIHEVSLQAGPAMLIEEVDGRGAVKRVTVVRSTSELMYSVSSRDRELSMKVADALP
jgi:hypothetical protein